MLTGYINFVGGRYANTGDRGISSAELLAKLYLKGGHRFELGYTYNLVETADRGTFLSMPNNWFNLVMVNNLGHDFELATTLHVYGAFEDPNRRVEARGLKTDPVNGSADINDPTQTVSVRAYETVIDRQPPAADLQVGIRFHGMHDRLEVQSTVYNAFAYARPSYDGYNDLEPRLEITPSTFPGFRWFTSVTYAF
jgi:hypothetical protein